MNKIIFLDIDGTLVNDNGIVPESAKIAVKKAREKGHKCFLCTGRSKAEIYPEIMEIGFDGIIAAAGGYIEYRDKVILHKKVSSEATKHVIDFFQDNNVDFYLESNGGLFASENLKKRLRKILFSDIDENPKKKEELEKGMSPFLDALIEGQNLFREDINKISFLESHLPFEKIQKEFAKEFNVIHCTVPAFGERSGELSIPDVHKATAIEILLEHLEAKNAETYAYGDGMNDAEMIQYVKYGIAMGNAKEGLKKIASDITDTHDHDGIYKSFKKYGLI